MKFERGLKPKEAMGIGKEGALKKHPHLPDLDKLFPNLTLTEIYSLLERLESAEDLWETNQKRYNNGTGNTEGKGSPCIKYLLICEAPPVGGQYFYKNPKGYLFNQVWKCFFGSQPVCSNPNNAYQCLADIGFLLIDSLPFPQKYTSKDRQKPAYQMMIDKYLPVWEQKLDSNFIFCADLKIAFGFKLNAYAVLKAAPNGIMLSGIQRPLSQNMIATSGSGLPTSDKLVQTFGVKWGSFSCTHC